MRPVQVTLLFFTLVLASSCTEKQSQTHQAPPETLVVPHPCTRADVTATVVGNVGPGIVVRLPDGKPAVVLSYGTQEFGGWKCEK